MPRRPELMQHLERTEDTARVDVEEEEEEGGGTRRGFPQAGNGRARPRPVGPRRGRGAGGRGQQGYWKRQGGVNVLVLFFLMKGTSNPS